MPKYPLYYSCLILISFSQNVTMQVVSSAIIDKYIGESARLIREMFGYARDHQVRNSICTIFCLQTRFDTPRIYIKGHFFVSYEALHHIYG